MERSDCPPQRRIQAQQHEIDGVLDRYLIQSCRGALERGAPVRLALPIRNADRATGTMLGGELTRRRPHGLPDDTIRIKFSGSAGQSFGAFVPRGITLELEGDANDYFGKGLSGGRLIVYPPKASRFRAEENVLIGNVAAYGATGGELFVRGLAGERFCVRNSGLHAVVEGVGDHGCEYMTGGRVVVLGPAGRNFAAGMSGGIAYVLDEDDQFRARCNLAMVGLEPLDDADARDVLLPLLIRHVEYTGSALAERVLRDWRVLRASFVKVMPHDYRRALERTADAVPEAAVAD